MVKMFFTDENGVRYERITRRAAKKLFSEGKHYWCCGNRLRPFESMWHPEVKIDPKEGSTFEKRDAIALFYNTGKGMGNRLNYFKEVK